MKLNRNRIKYILIIAMLIDHIAWAFVPTFSVLGQILHFIGRLTGPSMAVLLAEGFQYTKDRKKYAVRLFIFALISWPAFSLFESGKWPELGQGVIYSLFIAYMVIWMWDSLKIHKALKIMLVVLVCMLSMIGDWACFAVLWAFFSYIYREDPKSKWTAFSIVAAIEVFLSMGMSAISPNGNPLRSLFQIGVFMVPFLLIFVYNGEKGSKAAIHKWFFYIFYPLHLVAMYLIKAFLLPALIK